MGKPLYRILYKYYFEDRGIKVFEILLDPDTITLVLPKQSVTPDWTKLTYHQCTCCKLPPRQHTYCPIAVNIAGVVKEFKNIISSKNCFVRCVTPERTYEKKTQVQDGLFSILGIIMATSNCPVMNFLKPMARFHLPFASVEETTARSTSLFLLSQYFEYKKGRVNSFDFDKLEKSYAQVQLVNEGLLERIRSLGNRDADKNAIITLHSISQFLSMEMDFSLTTIAHLFERGGGE